MPHISPNRMRAANFISFLHSRLFPVQLRDIRSCSQSLTTCLRADAADMQQLMLGLHEAALQSEHGNTHWHVLDATWSPPQHHSRLPVPCITALAHFTPPAAHATGHTYTLLSNALTTTPPALLCRKIADSLSEAEQLQRQVAALMCPPTPPPRPPPNQVIFQ